MALCTVEEGHTLSGAYVNGASYAEGEEVELEPQYAAFYVEQGVLKEGGSPNAPTEPAPEQQDAEPVVVTD